MEHVVSRRCDGLLFPYPVGLLCPSLEVEIALTTARGVWLIAKSSNTIYMYHAIVKTTER